MVTEKRDSSSKVKFGTMIPMVQHLKKEDNIEK